MRRSADKRCRSSARRMCLGRGGIYDLRSFQARPRRQHVRPHSKAARDLAYGNASDHERIRNQGAMAAPGHSLGAHQHDALGHGKVDTAVQASREHRGLHVVGIAAEARIPPTAVCRIRPRVPQATQTRACAGNGSEHGVTPQTACRDCIAGYAAIAGSCARRSLGGRRAP